MNFDERPIHIIYYIFINPEKEWSEIVDFQLMEMYNSGILECALLHIEVCCELENNIKVVEDFISNYFNEKSNCKYFLTIRSENNYEYQGINKLYEGALANPNKVFIYIHTKGMFFNGCTSYDGKIIDTNSKVTFENKVLTKYTFNKWKDILEMFHEDESELNKVALFPATNGHCWFNFFWASGKYLNTCEKPIIYNKTPENDSESSCWPKGRFYYELWLGSGDNSNGYVYNLLEDSYRNIPQQEAVVSMFEFIVKTQR
jgi:hypothetical protein